MGMMDNIRQQASEAMTEHADKVETVSDQAIQRAGHFADQKTGGKAGAQIDQAEQAADARIGE